jgi:hypothetical protein
MSDEESTHAGDETQFSEEEGGGDSPSSSSSSDSEHEEEVMDDARVTKYCTNKRRKDGQRPRKKRSGYHLTLDQKMIIIDMHDKTGKKGTALGKLVAAKPGFGRTNAPSRVSVYSVLKARKEVVEAFNKAGGSCASCGES